MCSWQSLKLDLGIVWDPIKLDIADMERWMVIYVVHILRLNENSCHAADSIFKYIILHKSYVHWLKFDWRFFLIDN